MPNVSSAYTKLLFEGLKKVSVDRQTFVEQSNMIDKIYTRVSSGKATEEFYSVGQVPDVQDFTGRFSELSMVPGYSTKIEAKQFGGFVENRENPYG